MATEVLSTPRGYIRYEKSKIRNDRVSGRATHFIHIHALYVHAYTCTVYTYLRMILSIESFSVP